jgi:hypothetical protein
MVLSHPRRISHTLLTLGAALSNSAAKAVIGTRSEDYEQISPNECVVAPAGRSSIAQVVMRGVAARTTPLATG